MDSNSKITKIYREAQEELKGKLSSTTSGAEHFKQIYESVTKKLDSLFTSKCKSQIEWMEAHTDQTNQGPVLKDKSKQAEFEKVVNELSGCLQKNDVGSQEVFVDFDNKMHTIGNKANAANRKCTELKDDVSMKNCFKNSISESLEEMDQFYHQYTTKFEELNKKL